MTDPTSPLMGLPVLDVPHPHRVPARAPAPRRPSAPNAGPPKIALPSAKKTIVGGVDDLPGAPSPQSTPAPVKIRPAVQKTILGTAPPTPSPAASAHAPAQKTKLGPGLEDEALRPTVPAAAPPSPAPALTTGSDAAPRAPAPPTPPPIVAARPSVEPVEVPTTSTSVALWMLVIAIVALIGGVAYTF